VIAAVVLAAGAAERFGRPKQQLLLPYVLGRLAESPVDVVVVVAGAHPVEAGLATVVACPDWERGIGASLRCGLATLGPGVEAAVVCLADGPNLSPQAVTRVLSAWRAGAGSVTAASYAGNRGHPVVIGRAAWAAVPDEGMRSLPATLVPCDDLGTPGDVDSADDLGRLEPPITDN
jgi:CTP:molybdopterin cytidylyltransferase MocA